MRLQEYLARCCEGQTLLLVSHDRAFLNAVCQETVELKEQQLRCVMLIKLGQRNWQPSCHVATVSVLNSARVLKYKVLKFSYGRVWLLLLLSWSVPADHASMMHVMAYACVQISNSGIRIAADAASDVSSAAAAAAGTFLAPTMPMLRPRR
jgi:hypothetical protein